MTPGVRDDDEDARRRRRVARREVILGWLLLPAGLVLMIAPFVTQAGLKTWLGCGFGGLLAMLGIGCLFGNSNDKRKA